MTRGTRWGLVAGACYVALALWHVRVVLPAPASILPINPEMASAIPIGDQEIVVATIARGARLLPTAPWDLYAGGQCFPMPNALTLGEHIMGNGLVGIVPYWLSGGEPIFTANVVYVLELVIAGLGMFALVVHFTGAFGPALVAGFVFGFLPTRLQDPGHPFLHGNQWTPFVLLFVHRVFTTRRWRDAAWLTLFVCLQTLESFYQVWALTLLVVVFGTGLAITHRRDLVRVLPLLGAGLVVVAGLAYLTLAPYLATSRTWGILGDRGGFLLLGSEVLPGGSAYLGTVPLLFAAVALLDRVRGRRRPDDPRLLFFLMGFVVLWSALGALPIPFSGGFVPSLTTLLKGIVPGLAAGRGMRMVRLGANVATAFLAGYGLFAVMAGRSRAVRATVLVVAGAAAMAEVLVPPWAAKEFFWPTSLVAGTTRPDDALMALYRKIPPGPVLDLPYTYGNAATLQDQAHYTFLGGYHHQQTGSCYNSNAVPIQADVAAIAARMSTLPAIDALHVLGFRTFVVHGERGWPKVIEYLLAGLDERVAAGDLARIGDAAGHHVYTIVRAPAPAIGPGCLRAKPLPAPPVAVAGESDLVPFEFRSSVPLKICRPTDPLAPIELLVRWREQGGAVTTSTERVRVLLPIAVAVGPPMVRSIRLRLPPPGHYVASITAQSSPQTVISVRAVTVIAPDGPPPPPVAPTPWPF
jgi:hypothetical protein